MINQSIFKSYDIRGIFPAELNEDSAFKIGKSFVKYAKAKRIVVCRDARISSDVLFNSLAKGITEAGADVFDIGQKPTECLYFALGSYDFEAGIMITASHNPKEYNGFKMVIRDPLNQGHGKDGLNIQIVRGKDFLLAMESEMSSFTDSVPDIDPKTKGKIAQKDIWKDYIKHILSFANIDGIKPFKVAIDASNGVAGSVLEKIGGELPAEIFLLNYEPDGNFPNHSPNPLQEGSSNQIKGEILSRKANLGFIFDGDADRVFLLDENGNMVSADTVLLIMAKYFLEKNPRSAIAYNAICSKSVPEFIKKWGGNPIRTRVGFVNVRDGLLKNKGIMGGELSGHYCFRGNFYMDSGMIAFLTLLQVISSEHKKVSEIVKELSPYAKSAEMNFSVRDKEEVLSEIKEKYSDGKQDYLDGVTVEYDNWWFNVRPSNTEPVLRLTVEADDPVLLDLKKKELSDLINS